MTDHKPIYENEEDHDNEQRLANFLAEKWKCNMLRQKKLSQFDFIAYRDETPVAFLEFRRRTHLMNDYKTVIISMTKLVAWHSMSGITKLPCLFVVEWNDFIAYTNLDDAMKTAEFKISRKTHKRRNAYDDQEVIAFLQTDKFKTLLVK